MKFTGKTLGSVVLIAVGALLYLLAVTGVLFDEATPATDVGLYAVVILLLGFGLVGLYVARRERAEGGDEDDF